MKISNFFMKMKIQIFLNFVNYFCFFALDPLLSSFGPVQYPQLTMLQLLSNKQQPFANLFPLNKTGSLTGRFQSDVKSLLLYTSLNPRQSFETRQIIFANPTTDSIFQAVTFCFSLKNARSADNNCRENDFVQRERRFRFE